MASGQTQRASPFSGSRPLPSCAAGATLHEKAPCIRAGLPAFQYISTHSHEHPDLHSLREATHLAGGAASDAEALSGLARAFFYAGAKTLLVSHWAVDSDAAVKLTTQAFAALRADPRIGRAEAFRTSAIAMMKDTTRPTSWTPAVHPAVWAPFVLVGGGRD